MTEFYLSPVYGAKSFYRKAKVIETADGRKQLKSYDTIVCEITAGGEFVKLWNGYSVTTARHINAFRALYGLPPINKPVWDKMPAANGDTADRYKIAMHIGFREFVGTAVFDGYEQAAEIAAERETQLNAGGNRFYISCYPVEA